MVSKEDVTRILERVRRGSDLAFFFDQLESPAWIPALRDAELFAHPPAPVIDGEYVSYPVWPASRYLARVAHEGPEMVFEIIQNLPETRNPRVHEDLVAATSSMPVDLARQLVPAVIEWIKSAPHLLLLPERVRHLVIHLAEAGAGDEAVQLVGALLEPAEADPTAEFGQRLRFRLSDYDFETTVRDIAEPLSRVACRRSLEMYTQLLDAALAARAGTGLTDEDFDDGSLIWRPDVADRSIDERYEPSLNALVDAVLDATSRCVSTDQESVFAALQAGRAAIFRRILLQALVLPELDVSTSLAIRELVQRDRLDDKTLEVEYLRALRTIGHVLPRDQRLRLVRWIKMGPKRAKRLRDRLGSHWPEYRNLWQARRLAALGDSIPETDREWASSILTGLNEDELEPTPMALGATWVGPTSPRTDTDLGRDSIPDIVGYLREWEPSGEWAAPSREGLGLSLAAVAAQQPARFSSNAADFIGLDPVYVRSLISGLRDALRQKKSIRWASVLHLCDWVVRRPPEARQHDWSHEDGEPDWGWTWTEVARLLETGLTEESHRIPKSYASQVRSHLLRLVEHPDPSPKDEATLGSSNMDPFTLSINTGRGVAAHGLIRFAWWRKKVLGRTRPDPKIRAALDRLVDIGSEPSMAVHSVFGRWFGLLHWVDPAWSERTVDLVFPSVTTSRKYWWAAWSAFVVFDRPTTTTHRLLREQYSTATSQLADSTVETSFFGAGHGPAEALASHLLAFYIWGLEPNLDSGILTEFFQAPGVARSELISQAGRLLRDHGDELSEASVQSLMRLWRSRREASSSGFDDGMRMELSRFAWWSGAPRLDSSWWLSELRWVVYQVRELHPASLALEALPAAAGASPGTAVETLAGIVRLIQEPWLIQAHVREVRAVVASAIQVSDERAHAAAIDLIHDLGARELVNLSDLL